LLDRNTIRSSRRNRRTRHRQPRFSNRSRPKGWLAPSLQSRVANVVVWTKRLQARAPITALTQILHRFDTQKLQNPEIASVEYQRGELFGYEVREYLLEKWGRLCAYCDAKDVPLQIEHIQPKSLGGTNWVGNLTLACECCNQTKGNLPVTVFLTHDSARLKRIQAQAKAPLKDAAAINSTRLALAERLKQTGLPLSFGAGGQAKFNRTRQDYPKAYWIDAACAGTMGDSVMLNPESRPLHIAATGRGQRQVVRMNAQGFPRTGAGRTKRVQDFQTGDLGRLVQPKGKYAGTYTARLAGIRADGRFDIKAGAQKITANWQHFDLIQRSDGYAYA
jgi:5-methylcytosine-specific restriction endonuclease McrA